jgi:hypothetical protein
LFVLNKTFQATDTDFVVPWQSLPKADRKTAVDMLTEAFKPLRETMAKLASLRRCATGLHALAGLYAGHAI